MNKAPLILALLACLWTFGCADNIFVPQTVNDPALLNPETDAPGLKVGDRAPALTLRDASGASVNLGDLYGESAPVVVTFYRGGWCPYCNRALAAWGRKIDDLAAAGGMLVAISPESPEHALETTGKAGLSEQDHVKALVDADGRALRAFRVGFALDERTQRRYHGYGIDLEAWNANGEWALPAPVTYVIDSEGVVQWVYADWDYEKRADPDEVIAAVKRLSRAN